MISARRISVIAILMLVVTLWLSSSALTEGPPQPETFPTIHSELTTSIIATVDEIAATEDFWTRESMLHASPYRPSDEVVTDDMTAIDEQQLDAGMVPGKIPSPFADELAKQQFPTEWPESITVLPEGHEDMVSDGSALQGPSATDGTSQVYTGYLVNYYSQMWKEFPYKAVGQLFFKDPGGVGKSCTASVISPNNIIVTAAHCVFDTNVNKWHRNFTFVPAYRNGAQPYGTFGWKQAWVLNGWISASGIVRRYDVALISLNNNSAAKSVTYYTGWLGRTWNNGYTQHHTAIGYPSNLPNGTKYTYLCAAESFNGGTDVIGMGCNMTYGSSGGPWLRAFAPYTGGNVNLVNSVVSGGTPPTQTFYGARFSSSNLVPLCNVAGC